MRLLEERPLATLPPPFTLAPLLLLGMAYIDRLECNVCG